MKMFGNNHTLFPCLKQSHVHSISVSTEVVQSTTAMIRSTDLHVPKVRAVSWAVAIAYSMKLPIWVVTRPIRLRFAPNGEIRFDEIDLVRRISDPFCDLRETIVWELAREAHSVYTSPFHPDLVNLNCSNMNVSGLFAPAQASEVRCIL